LNSGAAVASAELPRGFCGEVDFMPQTVGAAPRAWRRRSLRGVPSMVSDVDRAGVAAVHFPGRTKISLPLRGSRAAKTSIIIAL